MLSPSFATDWKFKVEEIGQNNGVGRALKGEEFARSNQCQTSKVRGIENKKREGCKKRGMKNEKQSNKRTNLEESKFGVPVRAILNEGNARKGVKGNKGVQDGSKGIKGDRNMSEDY